MSKNINFAVKISLLRRQEFFDFSVDFCDNFGPPKSQRVKKWKSYVINSQIVSKHIPYDLDISSKVKQRVLGTIEIWRKCPSTEALWGSEQATKVTTYNGENVVSFVHTTTSGMLWKLTFSIQFLLQWWDWNEYLKKKKEGNPVNVITRNPSRDILCSISGFLTLLHVGGHHYKFQYSQYMGLLVTF